MLVERGQVLATLTGMLAEVANGDGRLVFLGGEAGIGKTTLATALIEAAPAPFVIRRGTCDNLTTAAALGPIVEALPEIGADLAVDVPVDKVRIVQRIRDELADTPSVVLLEDLHWADEATLDALRMLGRRLTGLPALVLVTFRADEVPPDHPLTTLLGDLATSYGVVRMQLPTLSVDGVRALIGEAGSTLDPTELHRETDGNPFFVTEVLAAAEGTVPATVRDAVLARAHRLTAPARRVLAATAVLGRGELPLLVDVSGESTDAVDECVLRGMLVYDGEALTFRHELARLAIEQTVTPGELADLHAAALRALRASNRGDDRRLAHHASGCGDRAAVLEHATRAARYAARVGAHREAAAQYRLALRNGDPDERVRFELVASLSYECYLAGEPDAAHDLRLEAMQLAEQVGDVASVGVNQRWLSRLSWFRGRNDDAERWATRAIATLEPLGESAELAMAYSNFSQLRMLAHEPAMAVEWGERAIAMARAVGAREVEMHALNNVGSAHGVDADPALGEQLLLRSLEMALEDDAHEHAARAYTNLGAQPVAERRYDQAERYLQAGITYCTDRDLDAWRLYMGAWLSRVYLERGRTAAAASRAAEVLRHRNLAAVTRIGASVVAAQVAMRAGRPDDELLSNALRLAEGIGEMQRLSPVAVARAEAAWLADLPEQIVDEVDRAWPVTIHHPHKWELGELSWWLFVAGVRRETPIDVAEPFAAMLAGEWVAAAELWEQVGSPLWQAHALGRSPDIENARTALDMFDALDVPAVRSAVLRERQAAGLPVPRGPRASSRANAWGLTPREIEILELLTDGLSNAELARQLYLSEKTVGHHVSAILRKLGEPTRSRAVAAARRHGIVEQT